MRALLCSVVVYITLLYSTTPTEVRNCENVYKHVHHIYCFVQILNPKCIFFPIVLNCARRQGTALYRDCLREFPQEISPTLGRLLLVVEGPADTRCGSPGGQVASNQVVHLPDRCCEQGMPVK